MNRENPWRGGGVWEDFALADAKSDYLDSLTGVAADDLDFEVVARSLAAIADREHDNAYRAAIDNAAAEARIARLDRWIDRALYVAAATFGLLAVCCAAAITYSLWRML